MSRPTSSSATGTGSGASTAEKDPKHLLTGKGNLFINGIPTSGSWVLRIDRDYVEATTFGSVGSTWLKGSEEVHLDFDGLEVPPISEFDYDVARDMFVDDPVANAILDRMQRQDMEIERLRSESARSKVKDYYSAGSQTLEDYEMYKKGADLAQRFKDMPNNRRKSRKTP